VLSWLRACNSRGNSGGVTSFALSFAGAFELTPEGLKREENVDPITPATRKTGRKRNRIITGLLLLVTAISFCRSLGRAAIRPMIECPTFLLC
jgi:hypothetical protein